MQNVRQILGFAVVVWAGVSSALPVLPQTFPRSSTLEARQNPQTGLPDGLTDVDILEFALTLENLETAFYEQGFAKFPDSDFAALGLKEDDILNLKSIAKTEATHVSTLLSAVAATGAAPVLPCVYDFKFTNAAAMIATAGVLENVGVSAYLAAAPLVKKPAILTVAAEILTVEARHQTFIRTASKAAAIPGAFDTPLGIRAVFTIAANFIKSCPAGSNLAITPFPALTTIASQGMAKAFAGSEVKVEAPAATAASATSCAFVNGGQTGGSAFTPFQNGGCVVPMGLTGITYVHLTSSTPPDGILTDSITVAGPLVMTIN
ncbi:BgTH12-04335 [Blumeria graminis f. sp. triticale]|uniref:BgTH12-04335 n=1 Tax=Blumeria graminis f. sp. triticale TaxID=1689686 RepID=A0A9W4DBA0_BLUGR|nr:BgTH12-04335 [Blumeria graminis f. sp. triticale]